MVEYAGGNKVRAAEILGVGRYTIHSGLNATAAVKRIAIGTPVRTTTRRKPSSLHFFHIRSRQTCSSAFCGSRPMSALRFASARLCATASASKSLTLHWFAGATVLPNGLPVRSFQHRDGCSRPLTSREVVS